MTFVGVVTFGLGIQEDEGLAIELQIVNTVQTVLAVDLLFT